MDFLLNPKTGCLVCGKELVYGKTEKMEYFYCHKIYESNVRCEAGHFVCDKCHSSSANELIENFCIATKLENPLEIALILMKNPKIKMHGPEHHFLVPASLLAAYYNVKKIPKALRGKGKFEYKDRVEASKVQTEVASKSKEQVERSLDR